MSDELEQEKLDAGTADITSDLRGNNFKAPEAPARPSFVKPTIHVETKVPELEGIFTREQVMAMAALIQSKADEAVKNSKFNSKMSGQVIDKSKLPITDFSKLTLDDVYDLSVNIEAKPFMSADVLAIQLKDTNYEARWVNKNPQNLGDKIGKGFTYIEPEDLLNDNAIQTGVDAEGHFSFNDVVAMKIDKATYYRALRAAHERAISTTNAASLGKRASRGADSFMRQESGEGNDYATAAATKKMEFYDAGIEI